MERLYKLSGFARLVGVGRVAAVKWVRGGRVRAIDIHGGWYVPGSGLERLVRGFYTSLKRVAIYARVGGNTQRDD